MLFCCSDGRLDEAAQRHAERQHPRPRQFRRVPLHRGSTEHVHRADVPCADQWGAAFHHTQPRHLRGTVYHVLRTCARIAERRGFPWSYTVIKP